MLFSEKTEQRRLRHNKNGLDSTSSTSSSIISRSISSSLLWPSSRINIGLLIFLYLSSSSSSSKSFFLFASAAEQQQDKSSWSAGKFRQQSDMAVIDGDYEDAARLINRAIDMEPQSATNYFKLYRLHTRMKNMMTALEDITKACEFDPRKADYQNKKLQLLISLGQCDQAAASIASNNISEIPGVKADLIEQARKCSAYMGFAQKAFAEEDYQHAAQAFAVALSYVERAPDLLWQKAQSLYYIGDYYGVVSDCAQLLKQNHLSESKLQVYQLRGDAFVKLGDHEQAVLHYRECLKSNPEHKGCKDGHRYVKKIEKRNKKAIKFYEDGKYQEAIDHWWQAVDVDLEHLAFFLPTLLKIGQAHTKLGQHEKAIEEIRKHIDHDETTEGLIALGDAQIAAEKYDEALRTFNRCIEISANGSREKWKTCKIKIQNTQVAIKQAKEKNYYKTLGVPRTATSKEIKRSYRELAMKWHPDKNPDNAEEAEKMFQEIGEAYEILSDDELKRKYDRGEPVFENQGNPRNTNFNQFFQRHSQAGGGHRQRGGAQFRNQHFRFN